MQVYWELFKFYKSLFDYLFFCCHQIKLAFFVAIVGVVLTVLGVGTEFWVELAPPKSFYNNQVKYWSSNLQSYDVSTPTQTHQMLLTCPQMFSAVIKTERVISC